MFSCARLYYECLRCHFRVLVTLDSEIPAKGFPSSQRLLSTIKGIVARTQYKCPHCELRLKSSLGAVRTKNKIMYSARSEVGPAVFSYSARVLRKHNLKKNIKNDQASHWNRELFRWAVDVCTVHLTSHYIDDVPLFQCTGTRFLVNEMRKRGWLI